jgi:predicted MFS family arabinose efflux permease
MFTSFGPVFPKLFAAAVLQELSFALMVHFPGYLEGLGISEATFGILYAASAVVALALRPAFGKLLDLTHRRTILLYGGAINALLVMSLAFTNMWGPSLWAVFLGHRVVQIGLFTAILTYAADAIPEEKRTQGLAIYGLSGLLPLALAGVLGDLVISAFGFDGLFIVSSLSMLGSFLLVRQLPTLALMVRSPRRGFFHAFLQRNLLPIWWITLSFTVGMETVFTFTRTFVSDRGVGSTGIFFAVYGLSAVVTRIVGGRSYDRIPARSIVVVAIGAYGAALLVLGQAESILPFVIAAAVSGSAHGAVFPVLSSSVVHRARLSERGSAMSIFTSIFDVALLLSAPLFGNLVENFSYTAAFSVIGFFLIFGGTVYAIWDKRMVAADALVA